MLNLFAVRKGLEPALRADCYPRYPPLPRQLPPRGGTEVSGSEPATTINKNNHPKWDGCFVCGAEGTRTLDLRRDRPAF